jgi:hypothetical protein
LHISGAFGATEKLLINIQYWCQIEEECLSQTAFGIPIPKKLSTELWLGTGLIKTAVSVSGSRRALNYTPKIRPKARFFAQDLFEKCVFKEN